MAIDLVVEWFAKSLPTESVLGTEKVENPDTTLYILGRRIIFVTKDKVIETCMNALSVTGSVSESLRIG